MTHVLVVATTLLLYTMAELPDGRSAQREVIVENYPPSGSSAAPSFS